MKTFNSFTDAKKYSEQYPTELTEYKSFYDDGTLNDHCFLLNSNIHGESKWFYRDGSLIEHSFYKNGGRHGEFKYFDEDGIIKEHAFYINNEYQPQLDYLITDRDEVTLTLLFGENYENIQ